MSRSKVKPNGINLLTNCYCLIMDPRKRLSAVRDNASGVVAFCMSPLTMPKR